MGPAQAVCNTCTACVQGEVRGLGKDLIGASAVQAADVSKPFLRKCFAGLLRPAELGFDKFCNE